MKSEVYKICPKCGSIAEYSAYYGRNICTRCTWEWSDSKDETVSNLIAKGTKKSMRDILFRGKRKDNGEWVYCRSLLYASNNSTNEEICFMPNKDENGEAKIDQNMNITSIEDIMYYNVHPHTIGQYIGMKDSNGKKIYEGDIVRAHDIMGNCEKTYEVVFGACSFLMVQYGKRSSLHPDLLEDIKVIGNIHDNPDLLL